MFYGAYNVQMICPLWPTIMKNEFVLFNLMDIFRYLCSVILNFFKKGKLRVVVEVRIGSQAFLYKLGI